MFLNLIKLLRATHLCDEILVARDGAILHRTHVFRYGIIHFGLFAFFLLLKKVKFVIEGLRRLIEVEETLILFIELVDADGEGSYQATFLHLAANDVAEFNPEQVLIVVLGGLKHEGSEDKVILVEGNQADKG